MVANAVGMPWVVYLVVVALLSVAERLVFALTGSELDMVNRTGGYPADGHGRGRDDSGTGVVLLSCARVVAIWVKLDTAVYVQHSGTCYGGAAGYTHRK